MPLFKALITKGWLIKTHYAHDIMLLVSTDPARLINYTGFTRCDAERLCRGVF
ncbi:hypothetical protein LECLMA074M_07415 [Leclercia sp. M-A074-M]